MTGPSTFTPIFSSTNAFVINCNSTLENPTTDIQAMNNGFASVTPLNPDLTLDNKLRRFRFLRNIPFN
jgi:broad specificity polyphosphatase/5'/3'-nucleotidase SurE